MQTADFDVADFDAGNRYKGDENLFVRFYTISIEDKQASAEKQRPIFKEQEMCGIRVPGQQRENCYKANFKYKNRFPKHYKAFKDRVEMPESGTPLSEWGLIPDTVAKEMAFFNIKTVEQLSELRDSILQDFQGATGYKQKAQKWLDTANVAASAADMKRELDARDATIADLTEKLTILMTKTSNLEEAFSLASKGVGPKEIPGSAPTTSKRRKKVVAED